MCVDCRSAIAAPRVPCTETRILTRVQSFWEAHMAASPRRSAPKRASSAPAMARSPGPRSCGARAVRAPGALRARAAACLCGHRARPRAPPPPPSLMSPLSCRRWPGSRAPCVCVIAHADERRRATGAPQGPYLHTGHRRGRDTEIRVYRRQCVCLLEARIAGYQ